MAEPEGYTQEAVLAALQMAIQTEIDGHAFYTQFAAQTEDANARAMFERLAADEVAHLELLRQTKASLEESGKWVDYSGPDTFASLSAGLETIEAAPIFSRERVAENIVGYTSDLSALRVAYLIEKDAVDFYRQAAARTLEPDGRRMFEDLARMEQGHLDLLEGEYNFLRGQFQTVMGFAPF
jgi:rubrerythrin